MESHISYISVGSNLGDKCQNCLEGITAVENMPGTAILARSPFYETEPVDFTQQDWFVNGIIKVKTEKTPESLLTALKEIEKAMGRTKTVRFGPRVIDLDIVLYDELVLDTPGLVIPHPRMHRRRFVLKPICDIDPNLHHPVLSRRMITLYHALDGQDQALKSIMME